MEDINCKCCMEVDQLMAKFDETGVDRDAAQCIMEHPWFEATCLNPGTLQMAYCGYIQQYGACAVEGSRDRLV